MSYLPEDEVQSLFAAAKKISENTYSPYSHFPVGAAVLTKGGNIFTGTNVENASFGLTICAERIAVGNAISSGNIDVAAIAVYAKSNSISPCGACRQFILEFGADIIIIFPQDGKLLQKTISDLLPFGFTRANIEVRR